MLSRPAIGDRPLLVGATLTVVAWGVLAFGGNYPWAYLPLAIGAAAVGIAGLLRPAPGARVPAAVAIGLGVTALAALAQVVPLSRATLAAMPQPTEELFRRYDLVYANRASAADATHSLSVQPAQTLVAVGLFISFSLLMLGTARMLTRRALGRLTRGLIRIGALVAVIGVIQRPMFGRVIYGFWTPYEFAYPFGPFVNPNHFAGWMLMTLLLTAGYLCGRAGGLKRHLKPGWRHQVLWFASPEANKAILIIVAMVLMATSLLLTSSRSGIIALVAAFLMLSGFVVRHTRSRMRASVMSALLAVVVISAAGWVGVDRLSARFSQPDAADLDGRTAAWADAWHIAQRFAWTGTGLNTYGIATMFYQTADLSHHYSQAHNDYLQVAAEGGLLLGVPGLMTIVALVTTIRRRHREAAPNSSEYWIRVGAVGGMIAIGIQEFADFSLQMPGNAVLFSVLAGVALKSPSPPEPRPEHRLESVATAVDQS